MSEPTGIDILFIVLLCVVLVGIVAAIMIPIGLRLIRFRKTLPPSMSMSFAVGTKEKHSVEIAFRQSAELLTVEVDGVQIIDQSFAAGFKLTRSLEWNVGVGERHAVRLTKTRERLYGGLRPQQFVVTIDGQTISRGESRP